MNDNVYVPDNVPDRIVKILDGAGVETLEDVAAVLSYLESKYDQRGGKTKPTMIEKPKTPNAWRYRNAGRNSN